MSAKFDEFPSLPFQDIKEKPKRHGQTDKFVGGINIPIVTCNLLRLLYISVKPVLCSFVLNSFLLTLKMTTITARRYLQNIKHPDITP